MKNLKKVIALMIAFAMMLTFVTGVAFADETTDEEATAAEETVEETVEEQPTVTQPVAIDAGKYSSSVLRAQKFGIMVGDANGDLRPNDPVKRSEFMTMLVRALGYEAAAVAAKGITKFADVPAEHWASGYVNVTVQLGVTVGKSETSFAPDDYVTTTEALAFIERAMGYEVLAKEKGGWPTGYLVVAKDRSYGLNLLDGVSEDVNLPAPRGLIAKLFDNALAAPFYEVESYSAGVPTYKQNDKVTFLTKMGYEKFTTKVNSNDEDEFILVQTPYYGADDDKVALVPVADRNASEIVKELNGEFDLDSLMGTRVEAYVDEDGKIVDIQMTQKDKTEKIVASEISKDGDKIKIKADSEKKYDVVGDLLPYVVNFKYGKDNKADAFAANGAFGDKKDLIEATAVIYDGKVDFVYGFKYVGPVLVKDTVNNTVTGAKNVKVDANPTTYYINKNKDDTAKFYEVIRNGKEVDLADLKEKDILYIAAKEPAHDADNAKDNRIRFLAVNDTVTGELVAATRDGATTTKVRIDSKTYDVYETVQNTPWGSNGWNVEFTNTVIIRLTRDGKVFDIEFESGSVQKDYAIILNKAEEDGRYGGKTKYVKLLLENGEKEEYTVKKDSNLDKNFGNFAKGDLVEYELNSNNELVKLNPAEKAAAGTTVGDVGKRQVVGKSIIANEDAVLFNITNDNADNDDDVEANVITWSSLKDNTTVVLEYIKNDDGYVAVAKFLKASGDAKYAVIAEKYTIDGNKNRVTLITADGTYEYDTDEAINEGIGTFIAYSMSGSDEVTNVKTDNIEEAGTPVYKKDQNGEVIRDNDGNPVVDYYLPAEVQNVTSTNIKILDQVYVFADDVVVYFNEDLDPTNDFEELSKADLYKFMEVKLYIVDGEVVGVAVSKK